MRESWQKSFKVHLSHNLVDLMQNYYLQCAHHYLFSLKIFTAKVWIANITAFYTPCYLFYEHLFLIIKLL